MLGGGGYTRGLRLGCNYFFVCLGFCCWVFPPFFFVCFGFLGVRFLFLSSWFFFVLFFTKGSSVPDAPRARLWGAAARAGPPGPRRRFPPFSDRAAIHPRTMPASRPGRPEQRPLLGGMRRGEGPSGVCGMSPPWLPPPRLPPPPPLRARVSGAPRGNRRDPPALSRPSPD